MISMLIRAIRSRWPSGTIAASGPRPTRGVAAVAAAPSQTPTTAASSATPTLQTKTPFGNPLPSPLHVILPESSTRHRRVIIVGDIHGCAAELDALLDRCYYRPGVDILISVGDVVNKGPESLKALRTLQTSPSTFTVRGNHDDAACAAWRLFKETGQRPGAEKVAWVCDMSDEDGEWLTSLPLSLQLPGYGVAVVHAGAVPAIDLVDQNPKDLLTMRDVVPRHEMEAARDPESDSEAEAGVVEGFDPLEPWDWSAVVAQASEYSNDSLNAESSLLTSLVASERRHPAGAAWATIWRGPMHVLFGHDAKRRLQMEEWATGLDGGCVYGGKLYAAVLPPLDEEGRPMVERVGVDTAKMVEFRLGNGLPAFLVGVEAAREYAPPKEKKEKKAASAEENEEKDENES